MQGLQKIVNINKNMECIGMKYVLTFYVNYDIINIGKRIQKEWVWMSFYDGTSAFAPSTRRTVNEAMLAERYLLHRQTQRRCIAETLKEVERLLNDYASVLTFEDRLKANALNTRIQEACEYRRSFFICVLFSSYNVMDESHKKYLEILKLIAEHDPGYLNEAVSYHERMVRQCRGKVFEI